MAELDRTRPPSPRPLRAFDFPAVEATSLDNGLEIRLARMPQVPLVSSLLLLRAGEAVVDSEMAGVSLLAADALEGGTTTRTASRLASDLERIGAGLRAGAGWDATSLSLTCLAERLPEALAILADVARRPTFPADQLTRVQQQQLARIRQRSMNPSSLATDRVAEVIFGDHPYGRPLAGTRALERVRRPDVIEHVDRWYGPDGGGIVVVGDVAAEPLQELVAEAFGGWDGAAPERSDPSPPAGAERSLYVVDRPGSVQSEVRVGHHGVPHGHPDHFPLLVGNAILGGTFTSRLNMNLRERHGFTYGVRSRFHFRRGPGPFLVSTAVASDATAPTVREVLFELERFVEDGPGEDEVRAASDFLVGTFPLRLQSTGQVAGRLAGVLTYDLPADYHATYRDRIRAVSRADVQAAMRRHVRPPECQILVVGDAEAVAGPLAGLGIPMAST